MPAFYSCQLRPNNFLFNESSNKLHLSYFLYLRGPNPSMYLSNLNIFIATFLSAEVQDDANENNYFARKVFRKKMKVLPGTVVTSSPPPIPVRPFQSQNSAAPPAATNTAAVGVFKKKKIIKAFVPKYTTTPMPSPAEENGALNRTEDDPRCKL